MSLFDSQNSTLSYRIISIICQTLVYGIYLCLFPIAVYFMLSRRLYNRSRIVLFVTMVIMFTLSTIYWVLSVIVTFQVIGARVRVSNLGPSPSPATHSQVEPSWLTLFNAILLVNLILTDGVVVWRAWVICSDMNKAILMTPVVILIVDIISYVTVLVVRVGTFIAPEGTRISQDFTTIINFAQVSNLALSLLTNVFATSIIATKSWKYRKSLLNFNDKGQTFTLASRVMFLLVESGTLYILITASILVSTVIRVPFGTVGDIATPVAVQLAGIYPIIVLLVVQQTNSIKSTSRDSSGTVIVRESEIRSLHVEPLSFAHQTSRSSGTSEDEATA